jgi:hypothetical protein
LASLTEALGKLPDTDDLQSRIEEVAQEERDYHDNMPENMQNGERGEAAEEAASNLEEAASETSELGISDLSDKVEEIIAKLESARDGAA